MSEKYTEYNPDKGTYETVDFSQYETEGKITVYQEEDVSGVLKRTKAARNEGATDFGIKRNFWHWASLPTTVVYELMKKGLNPLDSKTCPKALEREIDRNYSAFKTTNKRVT
jgi:hypothetical protein